MSDAFHRLSRGHAKILPALLTVIGLTASCRAPVDASQVKDNVLKEVSDGKATVIFDDNGTVRLRSCPNVPELTAAGKVPHDQCPASAGDRSMPRAAYESKLRSALAMGVSSASLQNQVTLLQVDFSGLQQAEIQARLDSQTATDQTYLEEIKKTQAKIDSLQAQIKVAVAEETLFNHILDALAPGQTNTFFYPGSEFFVALAPFVASWTGPGLTYAAFDKAGFVSLPTSTYYYDDEGDRRVDYEAQRHNEGFDQVDRRTNVYSLHNLIRVYNTILDSSSDFVAQACRSGDQGELPAPSTSRILFEMNQNNRSFRDELPKMVGRKDLLAHIENVGGWVWSGLAASGDNLLVSYCSLIAGTCKTDTVARANADAYAFRMSLICEYQASK